MYQKYLIKLTHEERAELEQLLKSGVASARTLTHAHILLKSDCGKEGPNWTYGKICDAYNVVPNTITNVRKRYVDEGLVVALNRKKPDREYKHSLDGEAEAHLVAMVCGQPPEGKNRWNLRLLQKKMVELAYTDAVSHETIRTTLKKMNLSLG
jgi:hypothetical protein